MFDITALMIVAMLWFCMMQIWFERSLRRLRGEHESTRRVMVYALRDLHWRGVKETATGIVADCEQSIRDGGQTTMPWGHHDD